jgi:signal transduction histidine kinase
MDVNTIVVDVKASLAERARSCGISIETELDPDLPLILGDSDRLRGVIQNLSINAVQAMNEGGQLRIETTSANDYLVVAVSDTGEGISPEMQCQIWEPFFSTKKDGTGLGLAITRRVVEAHEGRINIDSSVGRGTRFVVELPINEVGAYAGIRE